MSHISLLNPSHSMRSAFIVGVALLAAIASSSVAGTSSAQEYRFQVTQMQLECYINTDASVTLDYEITFLNSPGAHPIDIVDIGLPQRGYRDSTGSVDGVAVTDIRDSTYVPIGVEMHLHDGTIAPGEEGTVKFRCHVPNMVYSDTTNNAYASFQIKPTWFDEKSQLGSTDLQVAIHLPPGVDGTLVKYQDASNRYSNLVLFGDGDNKHVVAIWDQKEVTLSDANAKYSLSFPQDVMQRVVTISRFRMAVEWLERRRQVQVVSGVLLSIMLGLLFFRFSHGTGCAVFLALLAMLVIACMISAGTHFLAWPSLLGLIGLNEWALSRRSVPSYLPAMATVEGGGIKRGLTAPQAAILLELPLGKVVALVVFGMLKKGLVQMVKEQPLEVGVDPRFVASVARRRESAAKAGTVIHDYEHPFIEALASHQGPVEKCELGKCVDELIQSTIRRMNGFDIQSTRDYYRKIVQRAWTEAESIGDIKQRETVLERNFDWMVLDPHWGDIWRDRGYTYRPTWSRPYDTYSDTHTGAGRSTVPQGSGKGDSSPSPVDPSLSEVAAGFAGWAETSAGRLASAVDPTAISTLKMPGGLVDLSGVDRVTSDVFEALAKSSTSGGGGGGGGCACACAGCACACACAGGGR